MPATEPLSYTDFEESICFDSDDPDFMTCCIGLDEDKENYMRYDANVPSRAMSLTSLVASNRSHSFSSINSLDEPSRQPSEPSVLSIEELRHQLHSCFSCGVSWYEEHVSLDCAECGGYSLERPCAQCDGKCHSVWKRDLTMSHACGKAKWLGSCAAAATKTATAPQTTENNERVLKPIAATASDNQSNVYNNIQRNNNY